MGVGVMVGVDVMVGVGVFVGVCVWVGVEVNVGVWDAVAVGVLVVVAVGVRVHCVAVAVNFVKLRDARISCSGLQAPMIRKNKIKNINLIKMIDFAFMFTIVSCPKDVFELQKRWE